MQKLFTIIFYNASEHAEFMGAQAS